MNDVIMNDTFSAILNRHEADDRRQADTESLLRAAFEKEFANAREMVEAAESLSLSAKDFASGKVTHFPIIPVRQSEEFSVKKHTESQVPYFHSHNFYELIYVHRGICTQQFKDGPKMLLSRGQCLLLCPSAIHKIEKSGRSDIILKLVIPCNLFGQTGGKVLSDISPGATISFKNVSETAEFAMLKLLREQSCGAKFKDLIIQSYLTILFAELADPPKNDIVIEATLNDYFEENIKTASLSGFAAALNYNADYVGRLIKNRTGKSFSELLGSYRINRAKKLLSESALTIEDVAFEVGYSNPSGFYKQFFSVLGMKPSEYRNINR